MGRSNRPPAEEEAPPVAVVAGKYRLTRMVGRGGMGSVWEGLHITLGTRVAIKFIESQYVHNREARQRFENEARAAAALNSRHVVQVFDHGLMEDGRPYIVMEFLSGEPLDRRLERLGRLEPAETARLVVQVCRALSKAHQAGIIHRDLKPENIFLVSDAEENVDFAKVVDFGIAKFAEQNMIASSTRTGSLLGTPYYMSPEQARGLRSLDHRSDLWSVGVIAYQCLVGQVPFQGESMGDLVITICTGTLPIPSQQAPGVTAAFDQWFARALARSPDDRFPSATALAQSLCEAMGLTVPGESWGTAASRVSGGVLTPSLLSPNTPSVGGVKGITPATPGSVTVSTTAPKRFPTALLALTLAALAGLGVFAWVKRLSAPEHPATALQPAPPPVAVTSPPSQTAAPSAAAVAPAGVAPVASVAQSEAPLASAPGPSTPPRTVSSPSRALRTSHAPAGSAKAGTPAGEPTQVAVTPPPPAQTRPAEPVPTTRVSKPSVDIDQDDPWRQRTRN